MNITNLNNIDIDLSTENELLEMAEDCKNRIREKNRIIRNMKIKIVILFGLIERYMDSQEEGFIEEARLILDKALIEDIGIEDIE